MNGSIKDFSGDIEQKLDRAYMAMGGSKKYGYDTTKQGSNVEAMIEQDKFSGGVALQERNIGKMMKQASTFLKTSEMSQSSSGMLPPLDSDRMPRIAGRSLKQSNEFIRGIPKPERR